MPSPSPEDKRRQWNDWYHRHKEEYDRNYAEYRQENRERISQNNRMYAMRLRLQAINHYGGKCACCGEDRLEFLAIDHLGGRGTGAAQRRELPSGARGSWFARWLKNQGYPEGYRVLCHNCNMATGLYGYCPHQESVSRLAIRIQAHEEALVKEVTCERCGKVFDSTAHSVRFCSTRCAQNERRETERGGPLPTTIACVQCGQEFKPRTGANRFCSPSCRAKYWLAAGAERSRAHSAAYYKEHREESLAASKAAYWRDPEKARERERNRRLQRKTIKEVACQ